MVRPRVPETDQGIQGDFNVRIYDQMQRRLRDRGWIETKAVIASGIDHGLALELGPGPGYLGLEWLKHTRGTELCAVEISPDMIALAEANAREYGLSERWRCLPGDARKIPFPAGAFDAVFSNGSLHEWSEPVEIFNEIHRVLKPGGRYFISDLRRDLIPFFRWFLYLAAKPSEIRPGLVSSLRASYTPKEIEAVWCGSSLRESHLKKNPIGFEITGKKT